MCVCSVYIQEGAPRQENWILVPNLSLTGYKMTGLLMVVKSLSGSLLCLNTALDQESRLSLMGQSCSTLVISFAIFFALQYKFCFLFYSYLIKVFIFPYKFWFIQISLYLGQNQSRFIHDTNYSFLIFKILLIMLLQFPDFSPVACLHPALSAPFGNPHIIVHGHGS